MNEYEKILKFLDVACEKTREHAKNVSDLNEKCIYHDEAKKISDCRNQLRNLVFVYEDYEKDGTYEVPVIKFTTITFPVKTV